MFAQLFESFTNIFNLSSTKIKAETFGATNNKTCYLKIFLISPKNKTVTK